MNSILLLPVWACLTAAASAATPIIGQAIAMRGGSLVIPLADSTDVGHSIRASLVQNGRTVARLDPHLVWIRTAPTAVRNWSLPSHTTLIQATPTEHARPILVLSLPSDGRGHLEIDGTPLMLHWADLPSAMPTLRQVNSPISSPDAQPPLHNPLLAWRCELLAAVRGETPPPLDRFEDPATRLIALAVSGPWRLAMQRLDATDSGVARRVAALLTGTARCEDHVIAAWLSSGPALDELLAIALAAATTDDPLEARALRWCERQTSLLAWITSDRGDSVLLSLANPEPHDVLAEVAWAMPGELPLASTVPAGGATLTELQPLPLGVLTPLLLEVGQNHMTLPIDRSVQDVEPPGLMLGPLYPNRTLGDVRGAVPPPPAPVDRQTFAQFRRLMGRWEIMLECRWTNPPTGPIGGESVTIDLRNGDRSHVIDVTPAGLRSTHRSDAPAVHVSVSDHAWLCRIVLPDAWVSDRMSIALLRTHADSKAFETWPTPCVPWRAILDPMPMNLKAWDQDMAAAP